MVKTKIFLGDLVHTWKKIGNWVFPLNIGYIAAYAKKEFGEEVEISLFKEPEVMINAIKEHKPDIVGLSYYIWNTSLNNSVFKIAKSYNPNVLTVGGGLSFTLLNSNEESAKFFFLNQKFCDSYVIRQGEKGFVNLLKVFMDCEKNINKLKEKEIAGCLINNLSSSGKIQIGAVLEPIENLDEIPSPYLIGLMDKFFDANISPIIETNRSCPYGCAFCAWGAGIRKMTKFSEERIFAELEYISKRCKKSGLLLIADANFSIFERDIKIAEKIYECHKKYGYPKYTFIQWNKTNPNRVIETASNLKGITSVCASFQSFNEDTLKAIERINLPLDKVKEIAIKLKDYNIHVMSELILGLPFETAETHINAIKKLIDTGNIDVFNYNLFLLPGTKMDSKEYRDKYVKKVGWRLVDSSYGIYEGMKVVEGQEIVLETNTMTEKELRSFRFIHFLLQFMWGRKWYFPFLNYLSNELKLHPVDFLMDLTEQFKKDEGEMGKLYKEFCFEHDLELFETYEELNDYWCREDNFKRLETGDYGKLNWVYTYLILLEHQDIFNDFVFSLMKGIIKEEDSLNKCRELLKFCKEVRLDIKKDLSFTEEKEVTFDYDILSWKENDYKTPLKKSKSSYHFFMLDKQKQLIKKQLQFYNSDNQNLTLRKVGELINPDDLFYNIKKLP